MGVFSFYPVNPKDQAEIVRVGGKFTHGATLLGQLSLFLVHIIRVSYKFPSHSKLYSVRSPNPTQYGIHNGYLIKKG